MTKEQAQERIHCRVRVDVYIPEIGHRMRTYDFGGMRAYDFEAFKKDYLAYADFVADHVEAEFPGIAERSDSMALIRQYEVSASGATLEGVLFTPRHASDSAGWYYEFGTDGEENFIDACKRHMRSVRKAEAIVSLGEDKE